MYERSIRDITWAPSRGSWEESVISWQEQVETVFLRRSRVSLAQQRSATRREVRLPISEETPEAEREPALVA